MGFLRINAIMIDVLRFQIIASQPHCSEKTRSKVGFMTWGYSTRNFDQKPEEENVSQILKKIEHVATRVTKYSCPNVCSDKKARRRSMPDRTSHQKSVFPSYLVLLTVSNKLDVPRFLLTLNRRHFLYSAVMTFPLRFQYFPSRIMACWRHRLNLNKY